jgi:competence protein ComEC
MGRSHPTVPDLRLLPPVLAGWMAARLGLTHAPATTLALSAAAAAVSVPMLCFSGRCKPLVPVGATLLVAASLATSAALHVYALQLGPVSELAASRARVTVTAVVTGDPKPVKGIILLPVTIDTVTSHGTDLRVHSRATVLARSDRSAAYSASDASSASGTSAAWSALLPSMHIELTGRLLPPKDPADGDAATLTVNQPPRVIGGPSVIQKLAGALRADLRHAVAGLPAEPAAVLPALTLGDTSTVPADTTADLKTAGLSYLVVVSGENN